MQAIEAKTQAPIASDVPIKMLLRSFCNGSQSQIVVPTETANAITEE